MSTKTPTVKVKASVGLLPVIFLSLLFAAGGWFAATKFNTSNIVETVSAKTVGIENLMSLVTNKVTTQVYYHITEDHTLLGSEETVIFGDVEILYGIDANKISKDFLDESGSQIAINLPDVEVISTSLKDGTLRVFNKGTLLQKLTADRTDVRYNRYLKNLKESAEKFALEQGLSGERENIARRVKEHYTALQPDKKIELTIGEDGV